jgi:hypothetical protein
VGLAFAISALLLVKPETVIAWHRKGFRLFWNCKSRHLEGRPFVSPEVRNLIRKMSLANPRWGAPRIHGELLKIAIAVSQATVAKYMAIAPRRRFAMVIRGAVRTSRIPIHFAVSQNFSP